MPTQRIPLAGSLLTRDAVNFSGRDQNFANCFSYAVEDAISGGKRIYTEKRRGFTAPTTVSGVLNGLPGGCVWQSNTTPQLALPFLKTGGADVQVFNQSGTQIGGDISTTASCAGLSDMVISGTGNLVGIFQDSGTGVPEGWFYPQSGAWTQITDLDFPPNQTPAVRLALHAPVCMDGRVFWMTTSGQIWNSDLNSISSYTAANYVTASSMPDAGVGLARSKDLIVAFGQYSIEFFENAGLPVGSPLQQVPNSVVRLGTVGGIGAITTVGEHVYFTGIDPEAGGSGIYRLNGQTITKISTPEVDKYLFGAGSNASCFGAIKGSGLEHVMFVTGAEAQGTAYAFCLNNSRWWKFVQANNEAMVNYLSLGGVNTYMTTGSLGATGTKDKIYLTDSSGVVYQDAGTNLTATIQTMPLDMGTDEFKVWDRLRLVGDRQSSACTVTVAFSDDDALTFTTAGTIDMSTAQNYLCGLGSSQRRVWKFTNAANVPLRLEAMELSYTVGT